MYVIMCIFFLQAKRSIYFILFYLFVYLRDRQGTKRSNLFHLLQSVDCFCKCLNLSELGVIQNQELNPDLSWVVGVQLLEPSLLPHMVCISRKLEGGVEPRYSDMGCWLHYRSLNY